MNRSELRLRVFRLTGRNDKTIETNDGLDFGLRKLSQLHPFLALRSGEIDVHILAGQLSCTIPPNVRQIVECRLVDPSVLTNSYPLTILRKVDFLHNFPNVAGLGITGRPTHVCRDRTTLFFNTNSSGNYVIRMTRYILDTFLTDGDESVIPDADEILMALATAYVFRSFEQFDSASHWDQEAGKLIGLAVKAEENDLGLSLVAKEWGRGRLSSGNAPWLDPFAGHDSSEYC